MRPRRRTADARWARGGLRVSRGWADRDTIDADRAHQVAHLLVADVVESGPDVPVHLLVHRPRDADRPRAAQCLQACRHVDAIAGDLIPVDDDVAYVDADAELDAVVLRHLAIEVEHRALHLDRASQ